MIDPLILVPMFRSGLFESSITVCLITFISFMQFTIQQQPTKIAPPPTRQSPVVPHDPVLFYHISTGNRTNRLQQCMFITLIFIHLAPTGCEHGCDVRHLLSSQSFIFFMYRMYCLVHFVSCVTIRKYVFCFLSNPSNKRESIANSMRWIAGLDLLAINWLWFISIHDDLF